MPSPVFLLQHVEELQLVITQTPSNVRSKFGAQATAQANHAPSQCSSVATCAFTALPQPDNTELDIPRIMPVDGPDGDAIVVEEAGDLRNTRQNVVEIANASAVVRVLHAGTVVCVPVATYTAEDACLLAWRCKWLQCPGSTSCVAALLAEQFS